MLNILEQFEKFARTKRPDEKYDYRNPKKCAVAQFATASGMADDYYGLNDEKKIINPDENYIFAEAEHFAAVKPHTFGALANRLKDRPKGIQPTD